MLRCQKIVFVLISLSLLHVHTIAQSFSVSYSPKAFSGDFSGRVLLYLSKDSKRPKDASIGIPRLACFAIDVKNVKPNTAVTFNDKSISFPVKLSELERGDYYVQALWDRNTGDRSIAHSADNIFSTVIKCNFSADGKMVFTINCTEVIPAQKFTDSKFSKELKINSALLSAFHHKPTNMAAAVVLPKEYYDNPQQKFPVIFGIAGFGGDYHRGFLQMNNRDSTSKPLDSMPVIYVYLDGNHSWGHSEYANSDFNGPWGDALVKEFIPALEKTYRCNGAKLLWGHSSGGWATLWLQIQYPEIFAATWSSSPDPVDFRSFVNVNLYEHKNMYYTSDSTLRAVGTVAGSFPWIYSRDYVQMENVMYRGEQMRSFDAVFGKKASDGTPTRLCNALTGEIDSAVVAQWKKYDISLLLRNNWETYKPRIDNKIRISVGSSDNFYLNRAVRMLENEMKKLNANMEITYFPGDHFTVATPEYVDAGFKFLANRYRKWLQQH